MSGDWFWDGQVVFMAMVVTGGRGDRSGGRRYLFGCGSEVVIDRLVVLVVVV